MKKYLAILAVAIVGVGCESNTYEDLLDEEVPAGTITYNANVKNIIDANCVSCHSQGGTASFRLLTNYVEVKAAVENAGMLDRIQRQNGEPGLCHKPGECRTTR